jgi:hypothetical protein
MTEPTPLRRPRAPRSADSSAVLAYLSELEVYTSAIEVAYRQISLQIGEQNTTIGYQDAMIARLEAELALKRGVVDQLLAELNAARTALDQIDRHIVGACESDSGGMPDPCEECGEMREIASQALQVMKKATAP